MKSWIKAWLIGIVLGYLIQDILGNICVVPIPEHIVYTGFHGCTNAIFQKIGLSVILVAIPLTVVTAISTLFKGYWIKGGIISLSLMVIISFFLGMSSFEHFIYLYGAGFVGGVLAGFTYGKLSSKEEEVGIIKWAETH